MLQVSHVQYLYEVDLALKLFQSVTFRWWAKLVPSLGIRGMNVLCQMWPHLSLDKRGLDVMGQAVPRLSLDKSSIDVHVGQV